jgi:hypothetical protein
VPHDYCSPAVLPEVFEPPRSALKDRSSPHPFSKHVRPPSSWSLPSIIPIAAGRSRAPWGSTPVLRRQIDDLHACRQRLAAFGLEMREYIHELWWTMTVTGEKMEQHFQEIYKRCVGPIPATVFGF